MRDKRALAHYGLAIIIMSIYGAQVCPYVESLPRALQVLPQAIILLLLFAARPALLAAYAEGIEDQRRTGRVLTVEMGLFVGGGIAITAFNSLVFQFPVVSGIKLITGLTLLGFYSAVDLTLASELRFAQKLRDEGREIEAASPLFPMSRKLGLFASISSLLAVGVFFLLINKDLDWLLESSPAVTLKEAQRAILAEFAFVGVVMLGHMLNVIASYARNLRYFFNYQQDVMEATTRGRLDGWVPVATNDEFGKLASYTNTMVRALRERTEEIQRTQDVTIQALASLAETRDNETGAHILRTQRYVRALAVHLKDHPRFAHELDDRTIDLLFKSAPLHDIGKVGIPDRILLKPGKLTDEEFVIMKTHAELGEHALAEAEASLGGSSFLAYARQIAGGHHEKWDGSGYPRALAGDRIPLAARLMAVADVYDALISKRVYKPAFPHDEAVAIIRKGRASHFDPDVVDAMDAIEDEFKDIAERYGDHVHEGETESPRQTA